MSLMVDCIRWCCVLFGVGALAFPICFSFFGCLAGRGYVFSRIFGLLFFSVLFWLGCSFGVLPNSLSGVLTVGVIFLALSVGAFFHQRQAILRWLMENRTHLLICEGLFFFAFVLIFVFRTADPNILGTEKPMEQMFINSILVSDGFPPHDGWLAGYSISYYYLGYVITALLVRLSGVASAVGFNLMLCTVFALAAASAYGLVNDWILGKKSAGKVKHHNAALLAPCLLLISANLEGLFEVLNRMRVGSSAFWAWVGLKELTALPNVAATWDITSRAGIWWWRASRVISDSGLDGTTREVIDEFPFFSFLLGDLHPHVIGIPFVLLAVAVCLNCNYQLRQADSLRPFFSVWLLDRSVTFRETLFGSLVCSAQFWLSALCLGALIFINTWDFPIYFALWCFLYFMDALRHYGWSRASVAVLFEAALPMGVACLLIYGYFLHGLSSQAGGIVPSGVYGTRTIQFLIMFGGLIFLPLVWVCTHLKQTSRCGIKTALRVTVILFVASSALLIGLFGILQYGSQLFVSGRELNGFSATLAYAGHAFMAVQGMGDASNVFGLFLIRRLESLPTLLILFLGIFLCLSGVFSVRAGRAEKRMHSRDLFGVLLFLAALGLILIPEYFYLRDFFGTRMNTIFKFYYQAWILLSLVSAYCAQRIFSSARKRLKTASGIGFALLLAATLIYPMFGIVQKSQVFVQRLRNGNLSLDGGAFYLHSNPAEYAAIQWLKEQPLGIILEKVGASYSTDNAVSVFSGYPAVSGPLNHESQWRGGYAEIGMREADVRTIYETRDAETARLLLEKYNVRYVFIGSVEREAYSIYEPKFMRDLTLVYDTDGVKIYVFGGTE